MAELPSRAAEVHNGESWIDARAFRLLAQTMPNYNRKFAKDAAPKWVRRHRHGLEGCVPRSRCSDRGRRSRAPAGARCSPWRARGGGCGFAKNRAVAQSSGEWLCFQDVDDADDARLWIAAPSPPFSLSFPTSARRSSPPPPRGTPSGRRFLLSARAAPLPGRVHADAGVPGCDRRRRHGEARGRVVRGSPFLLAHADGGGAQAPTASRSCCTAGTRSSTTRAPSSTATADMGVQFIRPLAALPTGKDAAAFLKELEVVILRASPPADVEMEAPRG